MNYTTKIIIVTAFSMMAAFQSIASERPKTFVELTSKGSIAFEQTKDCDIPVTTEGQYLLA